MALGTLFGIISLERRAKAVVICEIIYRSMWNGQVEKTKKPKTKDQRVPSFRQIRRHEIEKEQVGRRKEIHKRERSWKPSQTGLEKRVDHWINMVLGVSCKIGNERKFVVMFSIHLLLYATR